jgi:jasmonate ZIM domain-containing protein
MLLASKASTSSPPSVVRKPDSPISAPAKINVPEALPISTPAKINVPEVLPARQIVTQKPESSVSHLATTSSPISIMPQAVALSWSTSNGTIDSSKPKTTVVQPPVVVPTNQASSSQATPLATTSAATVIPRGMAFHMPALFIGYVSFSHSIKFLHAFLCSSCPSSSEGISFTLLREAKRQV